MNSLHVQPGDAITAERWNALVDLASGKSRPIEYRFSVPKRAIVGGIEMFLAQKNGVWTLFKDSDDADKKIWRVGSQEAAARFPNDPFVYFQGASEPEEDVYECRSTDRAWVVARIYIETICEATPRSTLGETFFTISVESTLKLR